MKDVILDFRLDWDEPRNVYGVCLSAGGREARADFDFNFHDRSLTAALGKLEAGTCPIDDLKLLGASLWEGLMAGEVGELFEAVTAEPGEGPARYLLRLCLAKPELGPLPWEALYCDGLERGLGFLASRSGYSLVRAPVARIAEPEGPPALSGPVKILAVVPAGSGLEVERELRSLDIAVSKVRDRVRLERLAGQVTPDVLAETLARERWDVVHFIGHGEQTESGRTVVRLNGEESIHREFKLDGEAFAGLFCDRGVRLAVLNCCQGAMPAPNRQMSGLGPFFLRAGVPAVVAMRYEIEDGAAVRFSKQLYQELLDGDEPGRVDLAVESAREALLRNQTEDAARGFITPVLFLAGAPRVFEVRPRQPVAEAAARNPGKRPRVELPERLLRAFREGRLVPVVGPRVLTAGVMRSGEPPAQDARKLARQLAERFDYPRNRDFEVCEVAGDWMDGLVLQWVSQLVQESPESYEMTEVIRKAYEGSRPPAVLSRIASWDVPGLFYLHFDGLLEDAFEAGRRPVRVAHSVRSAVPPGSAPLLVHVRGSYRQIDSLKLTEEEHDALWDDLASMEQEIVNLVRGHPGRSLLFLGSSPRDPLVKRLFSRLAEGWNPRTRGPVFFVCRDEEKGDPFWDKHKVQWIDADLDAVVETLTGEVPS